MTEQDITLKIDGQPGSYLLGAQNADWEAGTATITVSDCSHGGSIAQVEIAATDFEGGTVSTALELMATDVDAIIATLTRIRVLIQPEPEYLEDEVNRRLEAIGNEIKDFRRPRS